jgi:signal-transduction protein with cAMP-binding, CBS, and nucleotidyltransferase domain
MDKTKIVELLRSVPLFSDLGDHDLAQVADRMKEVHFSEGTSVATQGQSGVGFHLVVDGTAEVLKDGTRVAELRHGGYFGEIGLIDGGPRSATVSLVGWDFTPLLDNPSFTKGLLMGLCKIARQEKGG